MPAMPAARGVRRLRPQHGGFVFIHEVAVWHGAKSHADVVTVLWQAFPWPSKSSMLRTWRPR